MKMKKRNLIVAALVIALGAAVYLNWQFGGDNTLLTSSTKELGAAEYVNNDTTVTSPSKTKLSSKQSNYFADARTKREQDFFICFEKLFSNSSIEEISECAEESRDDTYSDFALKCADGVTQHVEEIDEIISSHLTGKWKIERLNKVSLGIMRLAVYELKYLDDIPSNVTINEAVELSKKFSGEDEYKFVNGVLGAIARDL